MKVKFVKHFEQLGSFQIHVPVLNCLYRESDIINILLYFFILFEFKIFGDMPHPLFTYLKRSFQTSDQYWGLAFRHSKTSI